MITCITCKLNGPVFNLLYLKNTQKTILSNLDDLCLSVTKYGNYENSSFSIIIETNDL